MLMLIKVLLLSIVEGVTEFLPISSTGHLLLVSHYLNMKKEFYEVFDIAIQLGAILAVISLYPNYFKGALKKPLRFENKIMAIAMLPILIIGFLFKDVVKQVLFNPLIIFLGLMIGGIALIIIDIAVPKQVDQTDKKEGVSLIQAAIIGGFQCLALWPGMSRSAMTIMGGMIAGLNRVTSASFSFLLAVPLMIIIVCYDLVSSIGNLSINEFGWIFLGIVCSYVVSFFTIKWFLGFVKNKGLLVFGVYRIIIATIGILITYDILHI